MLVEKRKHPRFVPPQNTFAALGKEYTKVGKLMNISQGGLAFEYLAGENKKVNSFKIDIFLVGNVFHLYNVPCEIIYDIKIRLTFVRRIFLRKKFNLSILLTFT